uniref:Uncharacterized protein n=1 Tax=Oryza glumipatula TaxID=40148 RepID=A0A0E0AZE1_9ORYZ
MTALAKRNLVITGEKRCPDRAVQERRSAATAVPGVQSAAVRRSAVPIDPVHFWLSPHAPDVAKESNQERVDREIPSFFLKSGRRPRRPSPGLHSPSPLALTRPPPPLRAAAHTPRNAAYSPRCRCRRRRRVAYSPRSAAVAPSPTLLAVGAAVTSRTQPHCRTSLWPPCGQIRRRVGRVRRIGQPRHPRRRIGLPGGEQPINQNIQSFPLKY